MCIHAKNASFEFLVTSATVLGGLDFKPSRFPTSQVVQVVPYPHTTHLHAACVHRNFTRPLTHTRLNSTPSPPPFAGMHLFGHLVDFLENRGGGIGRPIGAACLRRAPLPEGLSTQPDGTNPPSPSAKGVFTVTRRKHMRGGILEILARDDGEFPPRRRKRP